MVTLILLMLSAETEEIISQLWSHLDIIIELNLIIERLKDI